MDTEKCKIFMSVVEEGSFSAAAAKLGYTPAGVSYTVDVIEKELGFPLLARSHDGVSLSASGARVYPLIKELVKAAKRLEKQAYEVNNVLWGDITIGMFPSIATQLMPPILGAFGKTYPNVTIKLREGVQSELDRLLAKQEADFILCSYQKELAYQWIPLRRDEMCCRLPEDHPLARQEAIRPEQLAGEDLIVPAYGKDPDVLTLLEKFHIQANIKYTTVETDTAYAMVGQGLGIVVANELTMANKAIPGFKRTFDPPQYIQEGIYVSDIQDATPPARRFIAYLRKHLGDGRTDHSMAVGSV